MILKIIKNIFLLGLLVAAIFTFGDPQWGKPIYMFQAYTLNKFKTPAFGVFVEPFHFDHVTSEMTADRSDVPYIKPPKKYTGLWRDWYEDGSKASEIYLLDGEMEAGSTTWDKNGQINSKMQQNEKGLYSSIYEKGELIHISSVGSDPEVIFNKNERIDRRVEFGVKP